ncbi:unnamed protein product, partial [Phaeothamnion confervicola]
ISRFCCFASFICRCVFWQYFLFLFCAFESPYISKNKPNSVWPIPQNLENRPSRLGLIGTVTVRQPSFRPILGLRKHSTFWHLRSSSHLTSSSLRIATSPFHFCSSSHLSLRPFLLPPTLNLFP